MNHAFSDGSPVPEVRRLTDGRDVVHAHDVVARALAPLGQDQRTRVLLAAAVLFGIIRPGEPEPTKPTTLQRYPANTRRDRGLVSVRELVLAALSRQGAMTVDAVTAVVGAKRETVAAALSKQVSDGTVRRLGRGYYECIPPLASEGQPK